MKGKQGLCLGEIVVYLASWCCVWLAALMVLRSEGGTC